MALWVLRLIGINKPALLINVMDAMWLSDVCELWRRNDWIIIKQF